MVDVSIFKLVDVETNREIGLADKFDTRGAS